MSKSPFPGMDPYLESRWPEVHARLIVYSANQINQSLPGDLLANIEESLTVYAEEERGRAIRPDVHVSQQTEFPTALANVSAVALAEPELVKRPPHLTRHIEIVGKDARVVTAIEFISPWNKVGSRAREQYTRKQLDYIDAGVNLVEIDLVRQGAHVLSVPLAELPEKSRTPYMICVYRDITPDQFEVYRVPLQEPLPNIRIPLRPSDLDIALQLQPLVDACYHDGRYHNTDYQSDPRGTFAADDAAWIDAHLRELGRRT